MGGDSVRRFVALLLVVSAGLFITGSILEHRHSEPAMRSSETGGETGSEGSGEGTHQEKAQGSERLFGLDLERPGIVAGASAVTLALAVLVLAWRDRRALWLVALFALAFAVLDIREVTHQSGEHRTSLVVLASALALMHLATAGLAGMAARRSPPIVTMP